MKKNYSVQPNGDGFSVFQDDKALRSPRNEELSVPTRGLADAIAAEFAAQGERFDIGKMPLTQMALTAIDIAAFNRENLLHGVMRIAANDLLCFRDGGSEDLAAAQDAAWQAHLDWGREKFGVEWRISRGIVACDQPEETMTALKAFAENLDNFHLTGLSEASSLSGSVILGISLAIGRIDAHAFFEAAEFDSIWQIKKWGEDPQAQSRIDDIKNDAEMLERYFQLLR